MSKGKIIKYLNYKLRVRVEDEGLYFKWVSHPIELPKTTKKVWTEGQIKKDGSGLLERFYVLLFCEHLVIKTRHTADGGINVKCITKKILKKKISVDSSIVDAKDIVVSNTPMK